MSYKIICFKCRYCGKIFESQVRAEDHEQNKCKKNPYVFTCSDCLYCKKEKRKVPNSDKWYEKPLSCTKGHKKITVEEFMICQDKKIINV